MRAAVVVECEDINSAIRKQFYPDDKVVFTGINTWRGKLSRATHGARSFPCGGSVVVVWESPIAFTRLAAR